MLSLVHALSAWMGGVGGWVDGCVDACAVVWRNLLQHCADCRHGAFSFWGEVQSPRAQHGAGGGLR
eukprot:5437962-Alexandrium_andersonii.AAC.1